MLSLDRGWLESLHTFINEMKQKYTMELVYSLCKPRFNHEFALMKLNNKGYKMAVCSNSIRKTIEIDVKICFRNYFDFYISNEDVKQGKPSLEMYEKAITKLDFNPQCLIVKDNKRVSRLLGKVAPM